MCHQLFLLTPADNISVLFQAHFYPQTGKPVVCPVAAADVTPAQQAVQPANKQA